MRQPGIVMSPGTLAATILAIHGAVIAFNLFGLIAIPMGSWRHWRFIREPVWRWLHVASLAIVALQAGLGRACFLTIWQDELTGMTAAAPLIMRTVNAVIYWPLPLWVFAAIYLTLFGYTLALLWFVPPTRRWRERD